MILNPSQANLAEDTPVYCLSCSYCLTGISTGFCPECGRKFDVNDPHSYGSDPTQTQNVVTALKWFQRLHHVFYMAVIFILLQACLLPLTPLIDLIFYLTWVNLTGMALIVTALLTLQTYVGFKVFGVIYALFQLIVTIILSVFFLTGLVLIPLVVQHDIERRWKAEPL